MGIAQLTIRLPQTKISFLEDYAKRHNLTISEVIDQYIKQLQVVEKYSLHPDIEKHAGILPVDIDAKIEYNDYMEKKHQ